MKRKCELCGEDIPSGTIGELVKSGKNYRQIKITNPIKASAIFCPKHSTEDVVGWMSNKIEEIKKE